MKNNNAKSIADAISKLPKNIPIYIGGHMEVTDADSIGSSLSLSIFLNKLGYQTYVLLEKKDLDFLFWFGGDKSHIVDDQNIEPIHNFILLDSSNKSRLHKFEWVFNTAKYKINIDHHEGDTRESDIVWRNGDISSTSEMVYEICSSMDRKLIDKDMASLLYSGMMTDTTCFSRRLTRRTLAIAQKLINMGANYTYLIQALYSTKSSTEVQAYCTLNNEIQSYDTFKYVIVDTEDPRFKDVTQYMLTKKISEELRKLNTLDTFIMLIKYADKVVGKTMCRTGTFAGILAEQFGGGGHKTEGGFVTNLSTEEILSQISAFLKTNNLK